MLEAKVVQRDAVDPQDDARASMLRTELEAAMQDVISYGSRYRMALLSRATPDGLEALARASDDAGLCVQRVAGLARLLARTLT